MNRNNRILLGLLIVMVAFFVAQLTQLFLLRLNVGDVYPEYSSYRADPLGVRALYGALGSLPGLSVRRNIKPIEQLEDGHDSVLFICGANMTPDPENVIQSIERFVSDGGRLVITLFPLDRDPLSSHEKEDEKKKDEKIEKDKIEKKNGDTPGDKTKDENKGKDKDKNKDKNKDKMPGYARTVSIEERWGFSHDFARIPGSDENKRGTIMATKNSGAPELPDTVSWHSALYFDAPKPKERSQETGDRSQETGDRSQKTKDGSQESEEGSAESTTSTSSITSITSTPRNQQSTNQPPPPPWETVYSWNNRTVLMERTWGKGAIVLCSDSYFLSNEAMRNERHSGLLAWLVGPASEVIFDETHLGVVERPGTMSLMRKYRLEGLIAALCLLAALFIWMSAVSLTPKRDSAEETRASITQGRDSSAGLENLLRRNVTSKRILAVCAKEWQHAQAGVSPRGVSPAKQSRIQAIIDRENAAPIRERNPVEAYRKICAIVAERG